MLNWIVANLIGLVVGAGFGCVLTASTPVVYNWFKNAWAKATADITTVKGLVAEAQAHAATAKEHATQATDAAITAHRIVSPAAPEPAAAPVATPAPAA